MSHLAAEVPDSGGVLFLTPCHATPLYSHLHRRVRSRFLDCSPPGWAPVVACLNAGMGFRIRQLIARFTLARQKVLFQSTRTHSTQHWLVRMHIDRFTTGFYFSLQGCCPQSQTQKPANWQRVAQAATGSLMALQGTIQHSSASSSGSGIIPRHGWSSIIRCQGHTVALAAAAPLAARGAQRRVACRRMWCCSSTCTGRLRRGPTHGAMLRPTASSMHNLQWTATWSQRCWCCDDLCCDDLSIRCWKFASEMLMPVNDRIMQNIRKVNSTTCCAPGGHSDQSSVKISVRNHQIRPTIQTSQMYNCVPPSPKIQLPDAECIQAACGCPCPSAVVCSPFPAALFATPVSSQLTSQSRFDAAASSALRAALTTLLPFT